MGLKNRKIEFNHSCLVVFVAMSTPDDLVLFISLYTKRDNKSAWIFSHPGMWVIENE